MAPRNPLYQPPEPARPVDNYISGYEREMMTSPILNIMNPVRISEELYLAVRNIDGVRNEYINIYQGIAAGFDPDTMLIGPEDAPLRQASQRLRVNLNPSTPEL